MNIELTAVWAQVIFGSLAAVLLIIWFATGQKSPALRIGGAVSALVCMSAVIYTNYIA
jgi:hypothetical protein